MITPQAPSKEELSIVEEALNIRLFEESLLRLNKSGKMRGTVHTCIGQEMIGACLSQALEDQDFIFATHRNHGHLLALDVDTTSIYKEFLGKEGGICQGKGDTQHLYVSKRFLSLGTIGALFSVAAGYAQALKEAQSRGCAIMISGDGSLASGSLYETLNMAAVFELPLLIIIENNGYAQSTITSDVLRGSLKDKASAFDIDFDSTSIWNWTSLMEKLRATLARVRTERRPCILQIDCYRLSPHSRGDDFRPAQEVEYFRSIDPLGKFADSHAEIYSHLKQKLELNLRSAEAEALASEDVKMPLIAEHSHSISWEKLGELPKVLYASLLNSALGRLLEENRNVRIIGQDIRDPYGGAFKITKGLSSKFDQNIMNFPISERAMAGFAIGRALGNLPTITEFMFGDFLGLAYDEVASSGPLINWLTDSGHAGLVFRAPMGGGQGYGPTHSKSIEHSFFGISHFNVVALNAYIDPYEIFSSLLTKPNYPTLLIENKTLYSTIPINHNFGPYELLKSEENYPVIHLKPKGPMADVTFITYGASATFLATLFRDIFEDFELISQGFVFTLLCPLKINRIDEYIRSSVVIIIEDGPSNFGFASEVITQLATINPSSTKFFRIGASSSIVPAAQNLEKEAIPTIESVKASVYAFLKRVLP